jgi:citrate synthase
MKGDEAMAVRHDRGAAARGQTDRWQTALTSIAPNSILIRGYPVDEMMGRLSFADAVYLLLMGELPSPAIGRMLNAVLVSSLDHGVTPPSTLAARNVATSGAPLKDCVAAGILAFGRHHGGDIETCMRFLDAGLNLVRSGRTYQQAAETLVEDCLREHQTPPGFGHRFHTRDPRAARLFQMALELELEGEHVRMIRATEQALDAREAQLGHRLPVNVDGAIAAICADLGFEYELGNAIFLISRLPGLIAHAHEERTRQAPMRQIDPKDHDYDGSQRRRLPESRK